MNASEPMVAPVKSSPRRKGVAIAVALVFAVAAVAAGVTMLVKSGKAEAKPTQTTPALTVTIARPSQASWAETLTASGAVAPWQEAIIGSQIGGYQLDQVRVNVGDHVKKGQVLARLNPDLLRAEEAQLVAAYDQAEANAKRAISLQGSGGISDQDVLQSTTLAKTARAQLAFKQLQLRYTDVIAPDDGVISARSATAGSVVSTGQELFRMILKGRLEWRGEVTAEQLARIAASQQVALALPGGGTASAVVRQTAPSLDSSSRLGLVYADIADGLQVRAGMYANGAIALNPKQALVVPAQSIVIRDGHTYVLKFKGDGSNKVERLAVVTGRRQGTDIEIVNGVAPSDQVVVLGAGFLNEGDTVRVASSAADTAAAPAAKEAK
ncbi:efflux RND transporter periplasmic adaptor subunit [Collimonas sp. OK412]|uniref:efflux RND transporter periplasmic adaptor subunit n=1 Tax=Collimonas sp. (strain OK412) TaxID=1801619 RepID=UPI0008EF484D|nr:efflux RND transporter periplasmic adaptor subunit [Collimonas sp. OK412]SFC87011.1 RND family efflux transporter, MFP subunit [Collimonas sp. OK412]